MPLSKKNIFGIDELGKSKMKERRIQDRRAPHRQSAQHRKCYFLKSIIFQRRDVTKFMPFRKVMVPRQLSSETMEIRVFSANENWKMLKLNSMHFPEITQKDAESMHFLYRPLAKIRTGEK